MTVALCEERNELRYMDNMINVFVEQITICKEYDGKDTGIGFGEFLLYEGKIDTYELESALHYQKEGDVIGARRLTFIEAEEDTKDYHILGNALFVDPDHQKKGVGSLIENKTIKHLQENIKSKIDGTLNLVGGIDPKNTKSIEFHKKNDWDKVSAPIEEKDADGVSHQYEWWKKEI